MENTNNQLNGECYYHTPAGGLWVVQDGTEHGVDRKKNTAKLYALNRTYKALTYKPISHFTIPGETGLLNDNNNNTYKIVNKLGMLSFHLIPEIVKQYSFLLLYNSKSKALCIVVETQGNTEPLYVYSTSGNSIEEKLRNCCEHLVLSYNRGDFTQLKQANKYIQLKRWTALWYDKVKELK